MDRLITQRMIEGAASVLEAARHHTHVSLSSGELDGAQGDGRMVAELLRLYLDALTSLDLSNNHLLRAEGVKDFLEGSGYLESNALITLKCAS